MISERMDGPVFQMIATLEYKLDAIGWDNPRLPALFRLLHRNDEWAIVPVDALAGEVNKEFLHRLGRDMTANGTDPQIVAGCRAFADGGLYGLIFAFEAHDLTDGKPNGEELRILQCVDVRGRITVLERHRRSQIMNVGDNETPNVGGTTIDALRMIVLATSRFLNHPDINIDVLCRSMLGEEGAAEEHQWNMDQLR